MPPRYRAALALTLALTASLPAAAKAPRHRPAHRPVATASISAEDIYSRRALRRARIIVELKLMELRAERLERVRRALEKHVPIDRLLKEL